MPEIVGGCHLDGKVVVVLFELLAGGIIRGITW